MGYGFVRSRPELDLPDLELMFVPGPFFDEGIGDPYDGHAILMWVIVLKPYSRGSITLRSRDPNDKPIIDPQYLTEDAGADRATLMQGLRICARIAESPALRDVIGTITRPAGADKLDDALFEEAINSCSPPCITQSAPAGWVATTPAWSTPSFGCAVSPGYASPTHR